MMKYTITYSLLCASCSAEPFKHMLSINSHKPEFRSEES